VRATPNQPFAASHVVICEDMATRHEHTPLHYALWAAQVFLAVSFAAAGLMKVALPIGEVRESLVWSRDLSEPMIRFIGICELGAVIALLIPGWTHTWTGLIPISALGLAGLMLCAIGFHLSRREPGLIGAPVVLMALSAFVAWGRWAVAPIVAPSETPRAPPTAVSR
jgi:uncharacterized membrane protein YphA (DoxX/SURF4 family)